MSQPTPDGACPTPTDPPAQGPTGATTVGCGEGTASYGGPHSPDGAAPLPALPGYEVLGVLGRGGMGVVYRARHQALKRPVALKMILAGSHAGPAERARFRAEAEAAARLAHPNIVGVYEVGEHEGLPYCALELVEGESLAQRLSGQPLSPRPAARCVELLAGAVHLAHSRNVVHRDLKPANVLLTADGTPKITDFGLARQLDSSSGQTQAGVILGTPSYMAPEQASGQAHAAGPAADVWALGAILYECLTGRPPFQGATMLQTLEQVRSQEPVSPRALGPQVPRDLETICLKCLRKEPEKRYASAQELADDLGRFGRGEPVLARPVGVAGRLGRWARRRPGVALLLAALVVLLIGASTALVSLWLKSVEAEAATARTRAEQAEERERAAQMALEQVEDTVAEDLLLPVGFEAGGLSAAEMDAFYKLAASRSERIRLRFFDKALAGPETAVRLARRGNVAVHAAVGLVPARRDTLVAVLRTRLQDKGASNEVRRCCIVLAAAAQAKDEAFGREAARALPGMIVGVTDDATLTELVKTTSALAGHLGPREAAALRADMARELAGAIPRAAGVAMVVALAHAARDLVRDLPADEAGPVVLAGTRDVLGVLSRADDSNQRALLAEAVAYLAEGLPPGSIDCRPVLDALERATGPPDLASLANSLASLAVHAPSAQATKACAAGAQHALSALLTIADRFTVSNLAEAIVSLARHMPRTEAAMVCRKATRRVFDLFGRTSDRFELSNLARSVSALCAHLPPSEADAARDAAARLVLEAMPKTTDDFSLGWLVGAIETLATSAGPKGAPWAQQAARQVLKVMAETTSHVALSNLAQQMESLAACLPPGEAAELFQDEARQLGDGLGKTTDPFILGSLAQALGGLAPRLPPAEAAPAARKLLAALGRPNDGFRVAELAEALARMSARLPASEQAAVCVPAAGHLKSALRGPADAHAVAALLQATASLAAQLPQAQAVDLARSTVPRAVDALAATKEPGALAPLAEALGRLRKWLPAADAARVSGAFAARAVEIAATGLPFDHSARDAAARALEVLAPGLPTERLIALWKQPTCVGQAQAAVLKELGRRLGPPAPEVAAGVAGLASAPGPGPVIAVALVRLDESPGSRRAFTDLWDAVAWLAEHHPKLDLSSPPQRPPSHTTAAPPRR